VKPIDKKIPNKQFDQASTDFSSLAKYQSEFPTVKLHRPQVIPGSIERPRLLEKLDQVLHKPLALVSAPAGFGKTILLTQWLDHCPLPNAWLQGDENVKDVPMFMSGVVATLRQLFPTCFKKTVDLLHAHSPVPTSVWISSLIRDLEKLENTPFILSIDDYHLFNTPLIDMILSDLLRYEAQPMHLILAARRNPPISFSRLNVRNMVVEIGTADLRFTDAEAQSFLHQNVDVPLSADVINQLEEKTEGWAAGLALAAISLRKKVHPEQLIAQLDDADRQVSDYLLEEVFNNQSREIQEFLLMTANFDQFNASMLNEVFDLEQGVGYVQSLLEKIESSGIFLTPLDSQRTYFRYHQLFRQMLMSRQRIAFSPEQITLIHRRAAEWLMRQGQLDAAQQYLITLQDWNILAQVVESQFCDLLNAEDSEGIKRRLAMFPESFISTRPVLLLMQAWSAHFGLRLQLMRSLIDRIQVMLDGILQDEKIAERDIVVPGFEIIPFQMVQANVWTLSSSLCYLSNNGRKSLSLSRQASDILPMTWLFVRGNAMIYLGLSMVMEGQYAQMVESFTQEYERLPKPRTALGKRLLFALGVGYFLQGELELCRQTAEILVRNAKELNLLLMLGWGYYLLGRVYQEWNELELAARYYKLVIDIGFTTNLYCSVECIAGYVFVLECMGQHELAQQSLDSLGQLFSEQIEATPAPIRALAAWLGLQAGKRTEARRWAESYNSPLAQQSITWQHIPHFYKAKILMQLSRPETMNEVDRFLDEAESLSERTHNTFTLIRTLVMRSTWLVRQGKQTLALKTLKRALQLGRPGGFTHSFIKQGPEMLGQLNAIIPSLKDEEGLSEYIGTIIDGFSSTEASTAEPANLSPIHTLLTERELDVLKLLAERLSINEISSRLSISSSTVQQHTHHIYRKLNVSNKRQAVASAEMLGILSRHR
jgi:LuxR family transcriptional regulator, maltose regulon positive regulatory protein